MRAAVALVAAALAIATPAQAASLGIISFAGSTPIISLAGPIAPGDDAKFKEFTQALRYPAIVRLSSYGGNTLAALAIGREIARLGYTTAVADSEVCASACGLIWLAGRQRISAPNAHVGLHATYLQQDGKSVETSPGNALVGKYLGELGYQDEFVVYATSAAPDDMAWLNRVVTDHFNIAWEMREQDVATLNTLDVPDQAPVPTSPAPLPATPPTPQIRPPLQIAPVPPPQAALPLDQQGTVQTQPPPTAPKAPTQPLLPPPPPKALERPQALSRHSDVKPPPKPPRTLQDDVLGFFFGDGVEDTPKPPPVPKLTHRASAPAAGVATPKE